MTSYSESVHVEETRGEPVIQVDYYINEEGQQVKRIIQRHKTTVTTVRNASTERRETQATDSGKDDLLGSCHALTDRPYGISFPHCHPHHTCSLCQWFYEQTVTRPYDSKDPETNGVKPTSPENEDDALNRAIQQTTQLDSDAVVVNGSSHIRRDGDIRVTMEEH